MKRESQQCLGDRHLHCLCLNTCTHAHTDTDTQTKTQTHTHTHSPPLVENPKHFHSDATHSPASQTPVPSSAEEATGEQSTSVCSRWIHTKIFGDGNIVSMLKPTNTLYNKMQNWHFFPPPYETGAVTEISDL